jgi:hypothetical protein
MLAASGRDVDDGLLDYHLGNLVRVESRIKTDSCTGGKCIAAGHLC